MAIKNASDLLVYKNATAVAQITKITVASSPLSGNGNIYADNVTNGSDVTSNDVIIPSAGVMTNNLNTVATQIGSVLSTSYGYTVSTVTDGVITVTNGTTGYVPTLSFKSGTVGTLDDGAITVEVITQGSDAGYEPIAFSTSASISFTNEVRDITNKDSQGVYQCLSGLKSFEMTTEALQDFQANLDFQNFYEDLENGTKVTLRFSERLTGGSDKYYQGEAFISSLSMDAGVEENVTYSVTFTGTASATEGTH